MNRSQHSAVLELTVQNPMEALVIFEAEKRRCGAIGITLLF